MRLIKKQGNNSILLISRCRASRYTMSLYTACIQKSAVQCCRTLLVRSCTRMAKATWQAEKERYLSMPVDEKRKLYTGKITLLSEVKTWAQYAKESKSLAKEIQRSADCKIDASLNSILAEKVSIFRGDITKLEVDAIVNAANSSLLGGGGVDGAIHRAAGEFLLQENKTLGGCDAGEAKISGAYKLPAKYVIPTVGPQGEKPGLLRNCYKNCMEIAFDKKLKSIAFPCISTGIYGYPNESAAHVAAKEIRTQLEKHHIDFERVIFCIFLDIDLNIYEGILQTYFPLK